MNEPTEFEYNGNLYIRFNFRAYKLPGQHAPFIHDTALLDKLEKAFSDQQRQHKGPRPPLADLHTRWQSPVMKRTPRTTPRETKEKRGGRTE